MGAVIFRRRARLEVAKPLAMKDGVVADLAQEAQVEQSTLA
jgi:hypothetical protein